MSRLRWKMSEAPKGLARIGAAPRSHALYNESGDRIASVNPNGGGWRTQQNGWYFVVTSASGALHYNSYTDGVIFQEVKEAKAAAVKYIKANAVQPSEPPHV